MATCVHPLRVAEEREKELNALLEAYRADRPNRELLREQIFGAIMMQQLRMGDKPASTWLGRVRQHAGENAWLFEPDYLRDDGYVEKKDQNGKPFWSLEEPS